MDIIAGNKIKSDKIINYQGFWDQKDSHLGSMLIASFIFVVKCKIRIKKWRFPSKNSCTAVIFWRMRRKSKKDLLFV